MRSLRLLFASVVAIGLTSSAEACTGIRLMATDGAAVYGRTLEFGIPLPTDLIIIPKGTPYKGTTKLNTQNGKTWESKYAIVGAAPFQYPHIVDGFNSEGLAVGLYYFPGYAKFQTLSKENQHDALAPWELGTFLLSQCVTVEDVKKILPAIAVVAVVAPEMGEVPPVHYAVTDAKGNSMVIEYIEGELKTYDNPTGVITNAPSFDWHLTNLNNYINLSANNAAPVKIENLNLPGFGQGSGMLGAPGDFTPPSRFVRAVFFSQFAVPMTNGDDSVFQLFHLLNQFDIPKGSVRASADPKDSEYTNWTSVSNLKDKKFYYRTYFNPEIKMVDLTKVNMSGGKITRTPMFRDNDQPKIIDASQ